jgi:hypothetical protein
MPLVSLGFGWNTQTQAFVLNSCHGFKPKLFLNILINFWLFFCFQLYREADDLLVESKEILRQLAEYKGKHSFLNALQLIISQT